MMSPTSWTVRDSNRAWLFQQPLIRSFLSLPSTRAGLPLDHPGEKENDVPTIDTELMPAQAEAKLF